MEDSLTTFDYSTVVNAVNEGMISTGKGITNLIATNAPVIIGVSAGFIILSIGVGLLKYFKRSH